MIYIATPLYENKVWVPFMDGFMNTIHEFTTRGMSIEYSFQTGTYIAMNRENLARAFLKTDCQFLLFIDSDIAFKAADVFELLASDVDVVSGIYRYRTSVPEGHPTLSARLVGGGLIKLPAKEELNTYIDALQECEFVPGGMLMIRRKVIEAMYAKQSYIFNQGFDLSKSPISIEEDFAGEDISFCRLWRGMGGKIWANLRVQVGHLGEFEYRP